MNRDIVIVVGNVVFVGALLRALLPADRDEPTETDDAAY